MFLFHLLKFSELYLSHAGVSVSGFLLSGTSWVNVCVTAGRSSGSLT